MQLTERPGGWLCRIRRRGHRDVSKLFARRSDAEKWGRSVERELDIGRVLPPASDSRITVSDIIERYRRDELPKKRGQQQDESLLRKIDAAMGSLFLSAVTPEILTDYRDHRLQRVSPQTVVHELTMVSRLFNACLLDWRIQLPGGNPVKLIRKPSVSNSRTRRLSTVELQYLLNALHGQTKAAFLLALETGARRSEILSLDWADIDLARCTALLRGVDGRQTKNGATFRAVPLSDDAIFVIRSLAPADGKLRGPLLSCSLSSFSHSFARAVARARRAYVHDELRRRLLSAGVDADSDIRALVYKKRTPSAAAARELADLNQHDRTLTDLRFHDVRHEATTRLADVFDMHELMKITGHKSEKMLARYYHPDAAALAEKLRRHRSQ